MRTARGARTARFRARLTDGIDGDKQACGFLIERDRDIAEKSGKPPAKIKSITRSGAKKTGDLTWKEAC